MYTILLDLLNDSDIHTADSVIIIVDVDLNEELEVEKIV